MALERFLRVLEITLPIFALIALGKLLSYKRILRDEHMSTLNWLVAYICLPALLFKAIATKDFGDLINPAIILGSIIPTVIVFSLMMFIGKLAKLRGPIMGVFIASGYWANSAYLGFPLAESAFGNEGLACAAILNAFGMPVFILSGSIVLVITSGHGGIPLRVRIRRVLTNPIILTSFSGIIFACGLDLTGGKEIILASPLLSTSARVLLDTLGLAGRMGLPLALLAVGTSIRLATLTSHKRILILTLVTKLVLAPLLTYTTIRLFFPAAEAVALGTTVLIMAMPTAVAFAIISRNLKAESDLSASIVVLTTLCSIVTTPVWLYFLL